MQQSQDWRGVLGSIALAMSPPYKTTAGMTFSMPLTPTCFCASASCASSRGSASASSASEASASASAVSSSRNRAAVVAASSSCGRAPSASQPLGRPPDLTRGDCSNDRGLNQCMIYTADPAPLHPGCRVLCSRCSKGTNLWVLWRAAGHAARHRPAAVGSTAHLPLARRSQVFLQLPQLFRLEKRLRGDVLGRVVGLQLRERRHRIVQRCLCADGTNLRDIRHRRKRQTLS